MPIACILSRAELGLDAPLVHVEVHLGVGLPAFSIVGLAAPVVRESRERVRSALLNSGYEFPARRITVNLAPVDLAKRGARFDLPIALSIAVASGQLRARIDGRFECYGELGLSGELKPVRGLFLAALHAVQTQHALIVPQANLAEVKLSGLTQVHGAADLRSAAVLLSAPLPARQITATEAEPDEPEPWAASAACLQSIVGQRQAKRALEVAAAGGHSMLLVGPPGSGKSLLAASMPSLLPALSRAEALEVAGVAALTARAPDPRRWRQPPFRSPHHTASTRAVVGGGSTIQPGEISLAHRGVLFLDELPEFDRRVLEALREPLESGTITLSRASGSVVLPARFQLIAAMNPCPCGYFGDASQECCCTPTQIARYRQRISGPLLDRIDIRVEVARLPPQELAAVAGLRTSANPHGEPQEHARLVRQLRAARADRIERSGAPCAALSLPELQRCSPLSPACAALLERSCRQLAVSARAVRRILALSRTIADLDRSETIAPLHLGEAIQLRRTLEPPQAQLQPMEDQRPTSDNM